MKLTWKRSILPVTLLVLLVYPLCLGVEYLHIFLQANNKLASNTFDGVIKIYSWGSFKTITPPNISICDPIAWSPDGRQIAFYYLKAPTSSNDCRNGEGPKDINIGLIDVQTHQIENLFSFQRVGDVESPVDLDLSWSPDGAKLLFNMYPEPHEFQLYLLDVKTRALQATQINLAYNPDEAWVEFDWNPGPLPIISISDLKKSGEREGEKIYFINQDFSNLTYVTDGWSAEWWQPDKKTIIFTRGIYSSEVYSSNIDGQYVHLLIRDAVSSAWSPDRHLMTYVYAADDYSTHFIVMYDDLWNRTFYFYKPTFGGDFAWASK